MRKFECGNQQVNFKFPLIPCIVILGERCGLIRDEKLLCWHGNRSGDFIENITHNIDVPIILTNIITFTVDKRYYKDFKKGAFDDYSIAYANIQRLIDDFNVMGFILLGDFAKTHFINFCNLTSVNHTYLALKHPSHILRFNEDKTAYTAKLVNMIYTLQKFGECN